MTTIKQVHGNLLSVKHGILVHGCNAKGKMGSGFADKLKAAYPGAFRAYRSQFEARGLQLGSVIYYDVPSIDDDQRLIIANAITQENYGRDKSIVYVDYPSVSACFDNIAAKARSLNLPVHFPLIGCGLANGDWDEVAARIEKALGPEIDKTLWIYR